MSYLEKAWYFAGWSDEIGCGEVKEIVIAERNLAVYRTERGVARVTSNRCPHRFAALHMGKVNGEDLECGYHGLRFGVDGRCVHNPHREGSAPSALVIDAYTVVERHGGVWFWLALDTVPDERLIPDLSWMSSLPVTAVGRVPTIHVDAHYQLFVDNLFDPVHADYLHATTLGGSGLFGTVRPVVEVDGYVMKAEWDFGEAEVLPLLRRQLADHARVETVFGSTLWAPNVVLVWGGVKPLGASWSEGVRAGTYHILTPAHANTTVYEAINVRDNDLGDEEMTRKTLEITAYAFNHEDKPMMEAMQKGLGQTDFWEAKPGLLQIDTGMGRVRRALEALIDQEQSVPAPVA